jgi:hypothetical protein
VGHRGQSSAARASGPSQGGKAQAPPSQGPHIERPARRSGSGRGQAKGHSPPPRRRPRRPRRRPRRPPRLLPPGPGPGRHHPCAQAGRVAAFHHFRHRCSGSIYVQRSRPALSVSTSTCPKGPGPPVQQLPVVPHAQGPWFRAVPQPPPRPASRRRRAARRPARPRAHVQGHMAHTPGVRFTAYSSYTQTSFKRWTHQPAASSAPSSRTFQGICSGRKGPSPRSKVHLGSSYTTVTTVRIRTTVRIPQFVSQVPRHFSQVPRHLPQVPRHLSQVPRYPDTSPRYPGTQTPPPGTQVPRHLPQVPRHLHKNCTHQPAASSAPSSRPAAAALAAPALPPAPPAPPAPAPSTRPLAASVSKKPLLTVSSGLRGWCHQWLAIGPFSGGG